MKKSATYIYPRPLAGKRRSWRIAATLACAAAVAGFLYFHDDGMMLSSLGRSIQTMYQPQADPGRIADQGLNADAETRALASGQAALPLPSAQALAAHPSVTPVALAARAAAMEEKAETPALSLATLGDGLTSLSFLKGNGSEGGSAELPAVSLPSRVSDLFAADPDQPEVYEANNRYTVETDKDGMKVYRSAVAKGDTAGAILSEWMDSAYATALTQASAPVYSLTSIREGSPFFVVRTPDKGEFVRFIYEIDPNHRLVVEKNGDGFTAVKEAIEYEVKLVRVKGSITSSLFEAVNDAGEGAPLAIKLAEVFSCEVNFINEIRQGDSFEALVEKRYRDGEFKGYGNMLAATFTNQGRTYDAYLFLDGTGKATHYNAKGEALQKTILKAPLAFTRVSSGYSMNRRHPVLGYSRPHQGVDYAAPTGTPIKAVGDGTIAKAGWGNGYGNMVIIKHAGGLESQYAHMSGFARGLKSGDRVRQGQIIGYVGATGIATGPHLDFRLKQGGNFINPAKVIVPRSDPVDRRQIAAFQRTVAYAKSYMNGDVSLAEYTPIKMNK